MTLAALLFAGLVFVVAPAFGAENDRAWSTPFVIGVRLEALPTLFEGFHGVTVEVAPSRFVSVELGGGFWFYGPAGLSTLHLQIPIGRAGIGLEAGLLTGSFTLSDCQYDVVGGGSCGDDLEVLANGHAIGAEVRDALFARIGPSFSWRTAGGRLQMRIFAGATPLLNRRVGVRLDAVTNRELPGGFTVDSRSFPTLLYAGMSLGVGVRP